MNFSRRGLLFSPYKLKRTCDYFALPITIPTKKQTKYSKIIQISFKFFGKIKEILKELLFPDARINIYPCVPPPENYSDCPVQDVPFFETPFKMPKVKKPPPDNIIFEKRKKCRSSASQTEFMLSIKDFSPSFAFFRDKDPVAWLDKLKESNQDSEAEETKVNRTVVRKILRRNMDLVQCDQLQISPNLHSCHRSHLLKEQELMIEVEMKFDDAESHNLEITETSSSTKSDSTHKVTEVPYVLETLHLPVTSNPGQLQPRPQNLSFANSDSLQALPFPSQPLSPAPAPIPAPQPLDSNIETAKKLFVQSPAVKPSEGQNLFQSNPFLNTNFIQKAEVPFRFGQNETPPTAQKSSFPGIGQASVSRFEANEAADTEMIMDGCGLGPGVLSANAIQTPNLQSSCLFTQNNPQELYNKTPSLFPNLSNAVPPACNFQTYQSPMPAAPESSVQKVSMGPSAAPIFPNDASNASLFSNPQPFGNPKPASSPQSIPKPASNPQSIPNPASNPPLFSTAPLGPSLFSSPKPQAFSSSGPNPAPALFSHPSPAASPAPASNPPQVPLSIFGASSLAGSSNSTPQSGSFKLGKIFSSKSKK